MLRALTAPHIQGTRNTVATLSASRLATAYARYSLYLHAARIRT
eukprot:COSAG05_NODE_1282_length_5283_cov_4.584684_4_plen_44_part_00